MGSEDRIDGPNGLGAVGSEQSAQLGHDGGDEFLQSAVHVSAEKC